MDFIQILEQLETTTGTNDKIALIKENKDDARLRHYLQIALSKKVTFGIQDVQDVEEYLTVGVFDRYKDLTILLNELASRTLTGNNAKTKINEFLARGGDPLENKWYIKLINKDLACIGIGQRLFEEAYDEKGFKFRLGLAETEDQLDKVEDGPGYLDLKANGVRTVAILETKILSAIYGGRNGLLADNFYFIKEELELLAKRAALPSCVFDGEMHVNQCLEDTMSLYGFKSRTIDEFMGKKGLKEKAWRSYQEDEERINSFKKDAKFVIFDYMMLDHWNAQECPYTLVERKAQLGYINKAIKELKLQHIEVIETERVENKQEAIDAAQRWVTRGFEGGIYKPDNGLYEWKRSRNWIKIKEEIDLDVKIIGFEISKTKFNPNGSPKPDMLGKFLVEDAKGAQFGIGTGHYLSEEKRIEVWENQDKYLGKILKCTAQRGSKNSYACPRVENVDWQADILRIDKADIED